MTSQAFHAVALAFRGALSRISELAGDRSIKTPIEANDPIGGALRDADLLVAYAAQSRLSVKPEKVRALTDASATIASARASNGSIHPSQVSTFWIAYDDFAVDITPLSAHSIRSSMSVNSRSFPASLLTPTAYNAAIAVAVFLVCLALQGFWVAGKELIERADQLEKLKIEVQQRQARNSGLLQRGQSKYNTIREKICTISECDSIDPTAPLPAQPIKKDEQSRLAALTAEAQLLRGEVIEKELIQAELVDELEKLNERGRPLETLLRKWHERARTVCDSQYFKFLCPVDNPKIGADSIDSERARVAKMRTNYEARRSELDRARLERAASSSTSSTASDRWSMFTLQRELQKAEQDLSGQDADRFRSIVVEVRIIVANIGSYLIAMVMGVLGALTFILRTLSQQLKDHTYVPVSASISIVRICLGAIAGVFGSLLVPNAESSLKSLPPLFVPFVFGYGIEILFSLLDKVVRTFTQSDQQSDQATKR